MAKEWWKSKSTTQSINKLIEMGVLHNQELGGCRAPVGESFPTSRPNEIVVSFAGIEPHFNLFHYLLSLRKKGALRGYKIVGGVYLNLRDGIKTYYLICTWNTCLSEWYN